MIPQVPRVDRLTADALTGYYVTTTSGQQIPLATVVSLEAGTEPNALTQYNQLASATFQAAPKPPKLFAMPAKSGLTREVAETRPGYSRS